MNFITLTDYDNENSVTEITVKVDKETVAKASFKEYILHSEDEVPELIAKASKTSEDESLAVAGTLLVPKFKNEAVYPMSVIYIPTLYVYPEYRNLGVGTRIIQKILSMTTHQNKAISIYVYPHHTVEYADGHTKRISNVEYHQVKCAMVHLLEKFNFKQIKDPYKQYQKCYFTVEGTK